MREIVVLSPHRDDAAFSLFICLAKWSALPVAVTVQNFFTRSAYASRAEGDKGTISGIRRHEDHRVLRRISPRIAVRDEHFTDAPLRLGIAASVVCTLETQKLLNEEYVSAIASRVPALRSRVCFAPLALGDHIDHRTVQRAAIEATHGKLLAFYEDLPYATWTSDAALGERINETETAIQSKLYPVIVRMPNAAAKKRRGVIGYRSQIAPAEANNIAQWANRYGGGERIWLTRLSRKRLFEMAQGQ